MINYGGGGGGGDGGDGIPLEWMDTPAVTICTKNWQLFGITTNTTKTTKGNTYWKAAKDFSSIVINHNLTQSMMRTMSGYVKMKMNAGNPSDPLKYTYYY